MLLATDHYGDEERINSAYSYVIAQDATPQSAAAVNKFLVPDFRLATGNPFSRVVPPIWERYVETIWSIEVNKIALIIMAAKAKATAFMRRMLRSDPM